MTAFDPNNVFTKTEAALWDLLEADALFAATIPAANRVKFHVDGASDPELDVRQSSDMPWFKIMPVSSVTPHRSSNGTGWMKSYGLFVSTGDWRTHAGINVIEYAVLAAFERTALTSLSGVSEVINVTLQGGDAAKSMNQPEDNGASPDGWTGLFRVDVLFNFARANL